MSRMCVDCAKMQTGPESAEDGGLLRSIGKASSLEEICSYCVAVTGDVREYLHGID